jgi:hypothetical protein
MNEDDIIPFPIPTSCTGRTMPAMTTAEFRERARDNYYSAERRARVDPLTAYERAEAFLVDLDRRTAIVERIP